MPSSPDAPQVAAVVLAAGGSARLGRPKQLLRFRGRSMIRRTVDAALDGGCTPVVVVLGAHADLVRAELRDLPVETVLNPQWSEGLSASIRAGIETLIERPAEIRAALLLACDQPAVDDRLIQRLRRAFDGAAGRTVACEYAGTLGPPALFERSLFGALTELTGDRGAKALLLRQGRATLRLPWPDGAHDLDREGDIPPRSAP